MLNPIHPRNRRQRNLERLQAYVSGALASGVSKGRLKKRLLQSGWGSDVVSGVLPDTKPSLPAVIALIGLVVFFTGLAVFAGGPKLTGFFAAGGSEWEALTEINVNSSVQSVQHLVVFGNFKPQNCADGILVQTSGAPINFTTQFETVQNSQCVSAVASFNNIIYDPDSNGTLQATYKIYYGKIVQTVTFIPPTPENYQIVNGSAFAVRVALSLPAVAWLELDGVNKSMTGNGTVWWSEENQTFGNHTFMAHTQLASSEQRSITTQASAPVPVQVQSPPPIINITLVTPTPANQSTLTKKEFTANVTFSDIVYGPMLELISNRTGVPQYQNLSMTGGNKSWMRDVTNLNNGVYEFAIYANNTKSEPRTVTVNYQEPLAQQTKSATITQFSATSPESAESEVQITAVVKNSGQAEIKTVSGTASIYKGTELMAEVSLGSAGNITIGNSATLAGKWKPQTLGKYKATVVIKYDNEEAKEAASFSVGLANLEAARTSVFQTPDGKAEFLVELNNKWVEAIPVVAEFKIKFGGAVIETLKSEEISVPPNGAKAASVVWDPAGRDVKSLGAEITVTYSGKSITAVIEPAAKPPAVQQEVKAEAEQGQKQQEELKANSEQEKATSGLTGAFTAIKAADKKTAAVAIAVIAGLFGAIFYAVRMDLLPQLGKPKKPAGPWQQAAKTGGQQAAAQPGSKAALYKQWHDYYEAYYKKYYPQWYEYLKRSGKL
ncbi:MAG: hypothetical protein HYT16_02495 [DPANN group archaeon]|nr:hypothetical protein [DPANN group archaeon]